MLLGAADDLTPYAGGLALARRWGVSSENLFRRRQGHFSVSLGLARDAAPLARIRRALLDDGGGQRVSGMPALRRLRHPR